MEIDFECTYCGYKWYTIIFHKEDIDIAKCPRCADKKIKSKDRGIKIDYYKGCPEFPIKLEDLLDQVYRYM